MRKIIKSNIRKSIRYLYESAGKYINNDTFSNDQTVIRLKRLAESVNIYIENENIHGELRILVPTTFNLSPIWWAHDGIISAALRMRGADVIPTICDRIQLDECMFFSGEWQDSRSSKFEEIRNNICHNCVKRAFEMWNMWGLNPVRLKSFVTTEEIIKTRDQVSEWMKGDWINIDLNGYPAGYEAWKATVNNDLQATISDWWSDRAHSFVYQHLFNIVIMTKAYERIFGVFSPDRVFGNGGFYYQWGVVSHIAEEHSVPYYRYHKIGLHKQSWNYARNCLKLMDVDLAWKSWLKQPWGYEKEHRVNYDLSLRGLSIRADAKSKERQNNTINQLQLDTNKPIVLALTGVAWDANTNSPSAVYKNVYEWLWDTIDWFKNNPDIQLIIRVHPAENVAIYVNPEDRTRFETETNSKGVKMPANVNIISPNDPISVYDLFHIANLGIVYFSTTGLEMACLGLPVITIGQTHYSNKGFTYDPGSRKQYFEMLHDIIFNKSKDASPQKTSQLAKKYWYLYAFHGSVVMNFFNEGSEGSSILKELTYEDLLPRANPSLDYICDAIINDLPIMEKNRWPPERK